MVWSHRVPERTSSTTYLICEDTLQVQNQWSIYTPIMSGLDVFELCATTGLDMLNTLSDIKNLHVQIRKYGEKITHKCKFQTVKVPN